MLTPKDILMRYRQWTKDHGHAPVKMTINPDVWNFLTRPDPGAVHPKPQPMTFQGIPVLLDPTFQPDQVEFE